MVEETILSPAQPTCGQCIYVICNKYGPKMIHFQFSRAMIKGLLEETPRTSKLTLKASLIQGEAHLLKIDPDHVVMG